MSSFWNLAEQRRKNISLRLKAKRTIKITVAYGKKNHKIERQTSKSFFKLEQEHLRIEITVKCTSN